MKTIEEAAIEICKIEVNKGCDNDTLFVSRIGINQIIERAFKAGVEFAQRWISVEEEPPKNEWINVKNEDKLNSFLAYGVVKITGAIDVKFVFHNFTHWRPIELK